MGLTKIELSEPLRLNPRAVWSQLSKIHFAVPQLSIMDIYIQMFGRLRIAADTMKDLQILALLKIPEC